MEASSATSTTQQNQAVSPSTQSPKPSDSSSQENDFSVALRSFIRADAENNVNEEDLFAAIVRERVKSKKGDEIAQEYEAALAAATQQVKRPNGVSSSEDATKEALRALRSSGKLSAEETDEIYSQAFAAAQLDGNADALFDGIGGGDDPTRAVASLEQALLNARTKMDKLSDGSLTTTTRSVDEASVGHDGSFKRSGSSHEAASGGFLYKPVSDTTGNLVILMPPQYAGQVSSVALRGPTGEILENGQFSGNGNGGRDHFRFSRPGSGYPDNLTVEVTLNSGEVVKYLIGDSSARNEGGEPSSGGASESSDSGTTTNTGSSSGSGSSAQSGSKDDDSSKKAPEL
jgi:hypothetical protein